MRGIVFTEFLEFVEQTRGPYVVEQVLDGAAAQTGGIYTAVGTYDHREMVALLGELSRITSVAVPQLLNAFGRYLFRRFVELYPQFFGGVHSSLEFLTRVDGYVHVEVRKLYPESELPRFECERQGDERLVLTYTSPRALSALAEGLMQGSIEHFGERIVLRSQDLSGGAGTRVRFELARAA